MFVVDLEFLDGKQNTDPDIWEIILTYVPIEGGVIDSMLMDSLIDLAKLGCFQPFSHHLIAAKYSVGNTLTQSQNIQFTLPKSCYERKYNTYRKLYPNSNIPDVQLIGYTTGAKNKTLTQPTTQNQPTSKRVT